MLHLATACLAMYIGVGLKSFQQLNVVYRRYLAIWPVSIALCACDFAVVLWVVKMGFEPEVILALGTAAALGSMSAMKLDHLLRKEVAVVPD